ncbi:hypothetical protein DSO57_1039831 [Entomophthora muscae]|uniref:Uncharacterized protein n=1 Tax=Entomophthora muscae TaxID=34485 RepID=A0ACC2S5T8_9FUNG|nr:hypothetical protein DSO57_1039831 [Entomophthora muscae]
MEGNSSTEAGKVESMISRSRLSHAKLLITASSEKRRPLERSQRPEGSFLRSQADEEIFPHRAGEVDYRSSRNEAKENTINLATGSIIVKISTKFGRDWEVFQES